MTGPDWRARKRAATRARITTATFALIAERGYERVSVGDIATAAGISVPTFYSYFPSKEHVVLPDQDHTTIAAPFTRQPATLPLAERIHRGLRAMIDTAGPDTRADLLRRWRLVLTVPALRSRSADRENASAAVLLDALGVDPAGTDTAAEVVVVAASLTASTTAFLRWAATDGRRPLEDLVDEAFAALRSIRED